MIRVLWACLCRAALLVALGLSVGSVFVIGLHYPIIFGGLLLAACWHNARRWKGGWSHGQARFITSDELNRCGMFGDHGLILGRSGWSDGPSRWSAVVGLLSPRVRSDSAVGQFMAAFFKSRWAANRIIRVRDYVHLATFSKTGGGKGVSVVIPTLRSYPGSMVTIDIKGENTTTAEFRRKKFDQRTAILDPMRVTGRATASMNPVAFIDPKALDFLDQTRALADMLVVTKGTESDPHWNECSVMVLTAEIAFVAACEPDPKERNLQTVREIVSSREKFARSIEVMQQVDNPVIRRLGNQLTWLAEKELSSVLTSVQRHTAWMDSPAVAACMVGNDFNPLDLRTGKVSVNFVLPPEQLVSLAPLMRMWIGTTLRVLSRAGASEHRPVLFMLDEIANLGRLQALEDAVTLMRGYGIRLWFIFQSLQQVQACYGDKAGVILENIGTQQFFAVNSFETAETISKRIGDETIRLTTSNSSTSTSNQSSGTGPQSASRSTSSGLNTAELARRVLKPEEILVLPEDVSLIFHRNLPVIPAKLLKYYNAPEFRWGGTGRRRGLGLAAGMWAACLLGVSVVVAQFVRDMPVPGRPWGAGIRWANGGGIPGPWTEGGMARPSIFPELEPWSQRRSAPSIFPELEPRPYTPPGRRPRRANNVSDDSY